MITPHEGELGRLLGRPSAEIAAARLRHAREAAARAAAPSSCSRATTRSSCGRTASPRSARARRPALATAGTGDVLAGVIGAMLATGLDAFTAAAPACDCTRSRGSARPRARGSEGMIASDVIEALAAVRG